MFDVGCRTFTTLDLVDEYQKPVLTQQSILITIQIRRITLQQLLRLVSRIALSQPFSTRQLHNFGILRRFVYRNEERWLSVYFWFLFFHAYIFQEALVSSYDTAEGTESIDADRSKVVETLESLSIFGNPLDHIIITMPSRDRTSEFRATAKSYEVSFFIKLLKISFYFETFTFKTCYSGFTSTFGRDEYIDFCETRNTLRTEKRNTNHLLIFLKTF